MFKNYFKIAWRNITRHKAYSALNIAGLSIGMACSILILLWVQHEQSYDRFNKHIDDTYRIVCNAGDFKAAVSPAGMAEGLQAAIPEIERTFRLSKPLTTLVQVDEKKFEEKRVFFADSTFFDFFSYELLRGDKKNVLNNVDGVLITEEIARKYFGNEDAMGKVLRVNNKESYTVKGILANAPSNSHIRFDIIFPMAILAKTDRDLINKVWGNFNFYTYLKLHHNISAVAKQNLLPSIQSEFKKHNGSESKVTLRLQPLADIHLHSDLQIDLPGHGNIQYVNIFFVVAIFILAVACINFMNLATARSARRAKEVGLRKVVGAGRYQIIVQFLGEALMISFLSLGVAIFLIYLLLPAFNTLAGTDLKIKLSESTLWLNMLIVALMAGIISGSYPALFLSGFQPIKVLKGKIKVGAGNLVFRNALVIVQFVVAILLLAGTIVVYQQLNFIKNKNLGYNKSNLLYLQMKGALWNQQQTLRSELQRNQLTSAFSVISDLPTTLITGTTDIDWQGKDPNLRIVIPSIDVDVHFLDVFKIELLKGRGFSRDYPTDSSSYVINEKAMQVMGMTADNAVGQSLTFGDAKGTIIGVVKDFNFKSLQYAIEPLVLRFNKYGGLVMIRTQPGKTEATIDALQKITQPLNPSYPFTYNFLDKDLDNLYTSEKQMGNIFNLFAILAIFISCLGLYGLSAFMAEQRTKEIGVRKVLGSSVFNIVSLLSLKFTRLIIIAMFIAVPFSWLAISKWLEGFAYRIDLNWAIFLIASVAALLIAWLTVGYESVKAAISNPVKSLRTE